MVETDWVEEPELMKTMLALQLFRIGDEVKFGTKGHESTGRVMRLDWEDTRFNCYLRVQRADGDQCWVHDGSLRAWRRRA